MLEKKPLQHSNQIMYIKRFLMPRLELLLCVLLRKLTKGPLSIEQNVNVLITFDVGQTPK